jgi:hypothetical protein
VKLLKLKPLLMPLLKLKQPLIVKQKKLHRRKPLLTLKLLLRQSKKLRIRLTLKLLLRLNQLVVLRLPLAKLSLLKAVKCWKKVILLHLTCCRVVKKPLMLC